MAKLDPCAKTHRFRCKNTGLVFELCSTVTKLNKNETVNITSKRDPNLMTENGAFSHKGPIWPYPAGIFDISKMTEFYSFSGVKKCSRGGREGVLYVPTSGPKLAVVAAKVARSIARLRGSMLVCVVWSGLPKCAICTSRGEKVNILSFCGWPKTQTPLRPLNPKNGNSGGPRNSITKLSVSTVSCGIRVYHSRTTDHLQGN